MGQKIYDIFCPTFFGVKITIKITTETDKIQKRKWSEKSVHYIYKIKALEVKNESIRNFFRTEKSKK